MCSVWSILTLLVVVCCGSAMTFPSNYFRTGGSKSEAKSEFDDFLREYLQTFSSPQDDPFYLYNLYDDDTYKNNMISKRTIESLPQIVDKRASLSDLINRLMSLRKITRNGRRPAHMRFGPGKK